MLCFVCAETWYMILLIGCAGCVLSALKLCVLYMLGGTFCYAGGGGRRVGEAEGMKNGALLVWVDICVVALISRWKSQANKETNT